MQKWLRRGRAAVGMGFTWAAAWFGAGIVLGVVTGFDADVPFPLLFALLGFIAGVIFSGLLALTEGRRRFDEMSLSRFAGWGGLGGLLLSGLFLIATSLGGENLWGEMLGLAPTFALAGAICAAGSLAVARRAERSELPAGRGNAAESHPNVSGTGSDD
jgi:hypothetical protein